jgi:hypothetical protein
MAAGTLRHESCLALLVPGRAVRPTWVSRVAGEVARATLLPGSFDDREKKKIIAESVRTSSVGSGSEGSGLWLGRFVRPCLYFGFCCGCSIPDSIVDSGFPAGNSVFGSALVGEEHCNEEEHCE